MRVRYSCILDAAYLTVTLLFKIFITIYIAGHIPHNEDEALTATAILVKAVKEIVKA